MPEKILWLSEMLRLNRTKTGETYTELAGSGYGRSTFDLVTRLLNERKDVVVADWNLPFHTTFRTPNKGALCRVYGVATQDEIYGNKLPAYGREKLQSVLNKIKPGLIIALGDFRMVRYLVETIPDRPPTIFVFLVDGENIPTSWIPVLECFDEIVTVSDFGHNELKKAGITDDTTIPLGVDTEKFKTITDTDLKLNKITEGLSANSFIVGYCGRNQQRKNLPALFDVFYRFNALRLNTMLYLHTELIAPSNIGWNLANLIELTAEKYINDEEDKAEFFDKVLFSFEDASPSKSISPFFKDKKKGEEKAKGEKREREKGKERGIEDKIKEYDPLCRFYNTFSSFATCTKSEGFCLPLLESMACGIPQVVPNHTTLFELCEGCGELVKIEHEIITPFGTINYQVSIEDFVTKLTKLHDDPQLCEKYSKNAVKKAKKYDYNENIIPEWLKLIDSFGGGEK